jgi:hypothetical protein
MSLKDMRDELRELRKHNSSVKAVSKMKKMEIALELEKLRGKREETPAAVSMMAHKSKAMVPKITDVKVAKEREFPVAPAKETKKKAKETVVGGSGAIGVEAKMSKKDMLRKMIEEMEDD